MDFSIQNNKVLLDGIETQIRSGAIHYFRTLPEQWEDRLLKLKQCGYNTVETYAAWHLHELKEGDFDFSGRLDIVQFIRTAAKLGLMAIVRPGPYICSECDLGGLPGWLLGKPGIRLRCENAVFMKYTERFFSNILPLLAPLQCTNGGNIIAMQVENEYASFASDHEYMRHLVRIFRKNGINVQLFTSDNEKRLLRAGTLPELPATFNFRNHPERNFRDFDAIDTGYANAHFAMELWNGKAWFWGVPPQHHDEQDVAADMREIMKDNASVNNFMFHGGTNFGFTSGASCNAGHYLPLVTSYEVDGVLDEGGNCGKKYFAIQKVIEEFHPGTTTVPAARTGAALPPVELKEFVSLRDSLDKLSRAEQRPFPETMEHFGQSFGFIHYETELQPYHSGEYCFHDLRDRAITFLNGKVIGITSREDEKQTIQLDVTEENSRLEILVENMGRVNYGLEMEKEKKGITGFSWTGNMFISNWNIHPLPLDDLSKLEFGKLPGSCDEPGFYRGKFDADQITDTYLLFPAGGRGCVYVNGFNLGRYWNIGPQRTLYIPSPLLKKENNEIVVFELHALTSYTLSFAAERKFDPMTPMPL
ncbi:MAG: beta-galactosidase [Lentisphaeria bacterium]|nr:beta-galactosidase [Lentisphaeria bacterium]